MDAVHRETGWWRLALAHGSEELGLGHGRTTRSDDPDEIVRQHRGEASRVGSRDRPILHSDLVGEFLQGPGLRESQLRRAQRYETSSETDPERDHGLGHNVG